MATKNSNRKAPSQLVGSTIGPKNADIKAKFAAGSIPLDTDFANLIDMADCGRKAIGQSPDQSDNSVGVGLQLASDTGKLGVLAQADGGLVAASTGVSVKAGSGITVDANGVSVDQSIIFPKGMIMMFSGSGVPTGWALCDGTQGTPDLRAKFVMGGDAAAAGEKNGKSMQGSSGARYATGTAAGATANITNNATNNCTLTVDQIPKHTHTVGVSGGKFVRSYGGDVGGQTALAGDEDTAPGVLTALEQSQGGGAHNHTISQSDHTHDVTVDIPYYTLMYIMKL